MREPALPCPPHQFDEPAARPDARRPLPVRPVHVRLEVRLDPTVARVVGGVVHTVEALGDGARVLPFDAADLTVEAATLGDAPCAVRHHAAGVDVELPRPLARGERVDVRLAFTARPTAGLYAVGPDQPDVDRPQIWTQGAMEDHHHWFPCFDAPQHLVTTEVVATVPEGYRALSNGVPEAEDGAPAEEGWRTFHWRHDTPHALYLLTLVVDRVEPVVDERGPVPLIHYAPAGRADDVRAHFRRLPEMLAFFGEATGRAYPYPRYGHVFLQDFMWGGMENTTLTSLTDAVFVPAEAVEEQDVERLYAHELAHQWFGDLIAPRGWPEIWLNESFATYFECLCMGALDGPDERVRRLQAQRDSYLGEARDRYARAVVTRRYAHPYVLFDRHAYEKGCLVLHTLRDQLGDDAWWRGLRRYVATCAGTAAETAQLRRCLEDESGLDLHAFFEHWIYGEAHPRLAVTWRYAPRVGLELTLTRQDEGEHALDLPVLIRTADGVVSRRVPLAAQSRTLLLPLDGPPAWVAVDAEQACLVELDETAETDAALRARLLDAQAPVATRLRTARLLGQRGARANTDALGQAIATDASPTVRAEVATALGQHRSPAARAILAGFVAGDAAWRVRAAAGAALGVGGDRALVDVFADLLATTVSPRVRAGLLKGLGEIDDPASRAVLRKWLDVPSPRDTVAAAAVAALAAQETASVFDELALRAEIGHGRPVRRAALRGLGRLGRAEGADETLKRRVRKALEARLQDSVFQLRAEAIDALGGLGDARARPALERAHGAEPFAALRRTLREALGKLPAA